MARLRPIALVAWTGLLTISAALVYALAAGDFYTDASELLENPWGLATIVDIYVGFALFSCWVAWREGSVVKASVWVVAIALGGNLVSAIYVLVALRESRGDIESFWHGKQTTSGSGFQDANRSLEGM